jgi:hypothetical protein
VSARKSLGYGFIGSFLWSLIRWALEDYGYIQIATDAIERRGPIVATFWALVSHQLFGPIVSAGCLAAYGFLELRARQHRSRLPPASPLPEPSSPQLPPTSTSAARRQADALRARTKATEKWIESLKPNVEFFAVSYGLHAQTYGNRTASGWAAFVEFTNRSPSATAKDVLAKVSYGDFHKVPYGVWIESSFNKVDFGPHDTRRLLISLRERGSKRGMLVFRDQRVPGQTLHDAFHSIECRGIDGPSIGVEVVVAGLGFELPPLRFRLEVIDEGVRLTGPLKE